MSDEVNVTGGGGYAWLASVVLTAAQEAAREGRLDELQVSVLAAHRSSPLFDEALAAGGTEVVDGLAVLHAPRARLARWLEGVGDAPIAIVVGFGALTQAYGFRHELGADGEITLREASAATARGAAEASSDHTSAEPSLAAHGDGETADPVRSSPRSAPTPAATKSAGEVTADERAFAAFEGWLAPSIRALVRTPREDGALVDPLSIAVVFVHPSSPMYVELLLSKCTVAGRYFLAHVMRREAAACWVSDIPADHVACVLAYRGEQRPIGVSLSALFDTHEAAHA